MKGKIIFKSDSFCISLMNVIYFLHIEKKCVARNYVLNIFDGKTFMLKYDTAFFHIDTSQTFSNNLSTLKRNNNTEVK